MKKIKLTVLCLTAAGMLLLAGCSAGGNNDTKALENKIDQLEQQVTDLEKKNGTSDHSTDDNSQKPAENTTDNSVSANNSAADLSTYTASVDELVNKIDGTTPTGSAEEQRTQYFQLKDELDAIDRNLDIYDDDIENQYKKGDLTYDDYKSKDRELEALEDKLDNVEDKLEILFGIDD